MGYQSFGVEDNMSFHIGIFDFNEMLSFFPEYLLYFFIILVKLQWSGRRLRNTTTMYSSKNITLIFSTLIQVTG
jgi:hypothetical protein